MSTSNNSFNPYLSFAIETLQHCLSDPTYNIQQEHPTKLISSFERELRHRFESINQNDSNITTDDSQPRSWGKDMANKVHDVIYTGPISHPVESSATTERSLEQVLERLLCFFLFGEHAIIKRRQIIYWWIGQGLINVDDGKDATDSADVMLKDLTELGAIQQVNCRRRKKICSKYKLMMSFSDLQRRFTDHQIESYKVLKKENAATLLSTTNTGIKTLFNFDVSILDIRRDSLRKMTNLKVLHLGRWSSNDSMKHIEIENVEIFDALKYLKQVRFISFKGVSRIMDLGYKICSLKDNLRVLDLQACPNLEVLPKCIGKLKYLTHLDLSECYLLDHIPKGITSLVCLQVVEGFVISDVENSSSSKFKDLGNYLGITLRKLSIKTRKISFPAEDDLETFLKFVKLIKLKVVWVKVSDSAMKTKNVLQKTRQLTRKLSADISSGGLPPQLQKLEVEAIPQTAVKSLLLNNNSHERLTNLKKLNIIGGEIADITDQGRIKWTKVEMLQLKYLTRLRMTWRQLRYSFPCVNYLAIVNCPQLSFLPLTGYLEKNNRYLI